MNFSLSDPKTRYQLLILVFILVGIGYFYLGFQPALAARDASAKQYQSVSAEILSGRQKAARMRDYAQKLVELKSDVDQIETRLLGGNRILLFLQAINDQAKRAGVTVTQLRPQMVDEGGEILSQPIIVSTTGSLEKTRQFLRLLEALNYPSKIDSSKFSALSDRNNEELASELTVIMYSLKGGE